MLVKGIAVGVLAIAGNSAGEALSGYTNVPLGNALVVASMVVPAVWWLSRWMQKISDDVSNLKLQMTHLQVEVELISKKRIGSTTR